MNRIDVAAPNKLGITDAKQLELAEGAITYARILELKQNPITGNFDAAHLKAIHQHIFQDVYAHAGKFHGVEAIRQKIRVSEATGINSPVYYPPISKAENSLENVLKSAGGPAAFAGLDKDAFAERMATLYAKVDYLHPFTEGNSRTLRVFTEQLAKEAGRTFDWGESNATGAARDKLYAARDKAVLKMVIHDVKTEKQLMSISYALHNLEKQPSLAQTISGYISAQEKKSETQNHTQSHASEKNIYANHDKQLTNINSQNKDQGNGYEMGR